MLSADVAEGVLTASNEGQRQRSEHQITREVQGKGNIWSKSSVESDAGTKNGSIKWLSSLFEYFLSCSREFFFFSVVHIE